MTNELKSQLMREIKNLKEEHEKDWMNYYFNNFFDRLPGGGSRLEALKRYFPNSPDNWEYDEKTYDIPYKKLYNNPQCSSLRNSQSRREFHKTIDDVFDELRIDPKPIIKAQAKLNSSISGYSAEKFNKDFEKEIIKVYIRLREKGYNHYPDLTA